MMTRSTLVHRLLLGVWAVVILWQALEHLRVRDQARSAVVRRARDIASTLGVVIRSQRRFGGVVSKPRIESALKELVNAKELKSVVLLNAAGEDVVSAGEPVDLRRKNVPQGGLRWEDRTVTIVNLVDLGTALQQDGSSPAPTIILPDPGPDGNRRDGRPRFPGPFPRREEGATNAPPPDRPPTEARPGPDPGRFAGRSGFRRPPWMNEEEYKSLIEKAGLHGLALVISTDSYRAACTQDLWLRVIIGGFAAVSVVGFGLAWRNLVKSSDFQMRLVRASELNAHLREMNVAAAGLAHETRNPLNIIRGVAQMISREADASDETRKKALEITDEVDRVTVQLNEFISYSKPREVRRSPVVIGTVVGDVVRALKSDLEDKGIKLEVQDEDLTVSADQPLLRQALFNLLMNAIQAVDAHGQIQIAARKTSPQEACLEVRDDGPGVSAEQRQDIFRPYFTTRDQGTGLGLAVVKQIVLAHGWEVECLPNDAKGALFRIRRLELVPGTRG